MKKTRSKKSRDTVPLSCEYLREFSKKFETVPMGYSGAGGKLIHEKNRSKKSRDTVPLRCHLPEGSLQSPYDVPDYLTAVSGLVR